MASNQQTQQCGAACRRPPPPTTMVHTLIGFHVGGGLAFRRLPVIRMYASKPAVEVGSRKLLWRNGIVTRSGAFHRYPGRKNKDELRQAPPRLPSGDGLYTPDERRRVICSYLRKRAIRLERGATPFIYESRSRTAQSRPRVQGRFVSHRHHHRG